MRSAVAPESSRAQVLASSIITSAIVSIPIICARGSAFNNQRGTALCFFLTGRSVGEGLGQLLGKGSMWAASASISSFPPTSTSLSPFIWVNLSATALTELHSLMLSWFGLLFWGTAGLCWSLQVPEPSLNTLGHISHIPYCWIDILPYCIWSTSQKMFQLCIQLR